MLTCWAGKMRSSLAFRGLPVGHPHLLHLHVQPKSRTGLFLASPLQPLPHFSLSPHAAPRNSHAGLEPLSPPRLACGAGDGHVHEAAVWEGDGTPAGQPVGRSGANGFIAYGSRCHTGARTERDGGGSGAAPLRGERRQRGGR